MSRSIALLFMGATACTQGVDSRTSIEPRAGSLRGVVRWEGPIPERATIDLSGNPDVLKTRSAPLLDERIVVNPNGTVHSVLVLLEIDPSLAPPAPELPTATMLSQQARFEPHVLAVRVGQPVTFRNEDATFYNVHLVPDANDEENFALTEGRARSVRFDRPEPRFIKVKSEVHPWMSARIAVVPHPWFAVTGADGSYSIGAVPAGRHDLILRHPILGEQRVSVTIASGATTTQDLTLAR